MALHKLYVVGDSISKGCVQNLEPGKKYSVFSGNMWNIVAVENELELTNKSVFCSTIDKGHRQLLRDLDARLNVDACVIEFGGNDCDYRWPELFDKGEANFHPNTSLDDFQEHLIQMCKEVEKHGMRPMLMTLPPLVADRYFNVISEGLDKDALLKWMHDPWFLYREQELYSDAVLGIAKAYKWFVFDIRKQFLLRRDSPDLMCDDGIHPNVKGHAFMASYIDNVIWNSFK